MDRMKDIQVALLKGMDNLRREECLCDVVFEIEGKQFPCHKNVLSAVSEYFKTMFTTQLRDPDEKVIELDFLSATQFSTLLDCLYTGKDILNDENAWSMLEIAHYTRIEALQKACIGFLIERLTMDNCITVWHLGQTLCLQNLIDGSISYVTENFDKLIHKKSLLDAKADDIGLVLLSPGTSLPSEDRTTDFLIRWLKHNMEHNTEETKTSIYSLLRLPLCSGEYLVSLKQNHKTIFKDQEFVVLFEHAVEYHLQPARASYLSMETEQRPASEYENVLTVFVQGYGVYAFSFQQKRWFCIENKKQKTDINFGICTYTPSVVYLSGGTQTPSKMIRYDGRSDTWSSIDMPFSIHRHVMVAMNNYLYVLGGRTKNDNLLQQNMGVEKHTDAVRRYDPEQDTWCVVGRLSHALCDASSVVINSKIYLLGGRVYPKESKEWVHNKSVYIFDLLNDTCKEIELDGYHFSDSRLFVFPLSLDILINDCMGNVGRFNTISQTFEKCGMLEKEGEIDLVHLIKNQWIVFRKKLSYENEGEGKDDNNDVVQREEESSEDSEGEEYKYDVYSATVKSQGSDIVECSKMALPRPPFDRNTQIIRCISVLIKKEHLQPI